MPQFDFSKIQAPPSAPPMSPENAAKMRELYPDQPEATVPKFDFSKVKTPVFDFSKVAPPKESLVEAGIKGAYEPFKPIVERATQPAVDLYKKGMPAFKKDATAGPEVLQRIGDIGGKVANVASAAAAPLMALPATLGQETEKIAARKVGVPEAKVEQLGKDTGDVSGLVALPGVKLSSAAKLGEDGKILTGAKHADIPGSGKEGFVTAKGQFVSREQADKIAKADGQLVQPELEKGKLHSEDIGQPVPEPPPSKIFSPDQPVASTKSVASVPGVADKLYQHRNAMHTDYKEFAQWAKPFKGVPESFWQKALDHLDDPKGVVLSPQEQLIFDRSVKPMQEEIEADRVYIKKSGLDPNKLDEESGSLGGAIRQRKGMNTPLDRMTGTKSVPPEGGKTLSRSAGTFKGRSMMALTKDGKRTVVYIDPEGQVFDAANRGNPIGHINPETGQPETGGKITDAARKEIERATEGKVAYHDNAFGVYGTTLLQTRRAVRSVKLLNEIKQSPDFKTVARAPFSKGEVPKDWREISGAPEFRGWRFDPRYAEEIEDFLGSMRRDQGALNKLEKLNRFSLSTLFWLNPIHAYNITDAFLTTKGAVGLLKDLPGTTGDLLKSIKSVATRDKYNMAEARAGVPMPGLDTAGEEFKRMTLNAMGVKARQVPKNFMEFIKRFGFDNPKDFFSRVSEASHKAVFSWQDVLQQTLERGYMRQGMSQAEATEHAARTFMNYRTPSRVLDQRWLGQALQGQAWLDFPKYSYGRLKGMYKILEGSAKLDPKSIDQLLMIAALYEFGQYAIDPLVKQYTGKSNAEFGNFGYTAFPDVIDKTMQGKRTIGQDIQSLGAPGYGIQALDLARGINPYLAKPVSIPGETPKEVGFDYASQVANKFSPIQRWGQVARGRLAPEDLWLEQLGVKFPGDMPKSVHRDLRSRERYGSPLEQELGQ